MAEVTLTRHGDEIHMRPTRSAGSRIKAWVTLIAFLLTVVLFSGGLVLSLRESTRLDLQDWIGILAVGGLAVFAGCHVFVFVRDALRNRGPQPYVTISATPMLRGGSYPVRYRVEGSGAESIRHVTLTLRCEEVIRIDTGSGSGSSRYTTRKRTLNEDVLVDVESITPGDLAEGMAMIRIPANAIPSSNRGSNPTAQRMVQWLLIFDGVIDYWPDVHVVFPQMVFRQPPSGTRQYQATASRRSV